MRKTACRVERSVAETASAFLALPAQPAPDSIKPPEFYVAEDVAVPMHDAPLPGGLWKELCDALGKPNAGIKGDQPDPLQLDASSCVDRRNRQGGSNRRREKFSAGPGAPPPHTVCEFFTGAGVPKSKFRRRP